MSLLLLILALLDPPPLPLLTVPERVQTYRVAWLNQGTNGVYQCDTNWLTKTWTNAFSLWTNSEYLCASNPRVVTTNRLMIWTVSNNPTLFSTNLGLVETQYFTVTTNAPFLKFASPPPPAVTNFIFTIYGSTNLTSWYVLTNLYVPNSQPFEWMRCGITPVIPR